MKQILIEFREFLKEYKVVGLAIAFIIGTALTALVQALVSSIVMPLVTFFLPANTGWQTWIWSIGPFEFAIGILLGALLNFIIIAFVVFMIAKFVLKEEKVGKK